MERRKENLTDLFLFFVRGVTEGREGKIYIRILPPPPPPPPPPTHTTPHYGVEKENGGELIIKDV